MCRKAGLRPAGNALQRIVVGKQAMAYRVTHKGGFAGELQLVHQPHLVGADGLVAPKEFFSIILGLSDADVEKIEASALEFTSEDPEPEPDEGDPDEDEENNEE